MARDNPKIRFVSCNATRVIFITLFLGPLVPESVWAQDSSKKRRCHIHLRVSRLHISHLTSISLTLSSLSSLISSHLTSPHLISSHLSSRLISSPVSSHRPSYLIWSSPLSPLLLVFLIFYLSILSPEAGPSELIEMQPFRTKWKSKTDVKLWFLELSKATERRKRCIETTWKV